MSKLLTEQQAAKRLQISTDTLRRARLSGRLRFVQLGRSTRIDPADLDAFIAESKTGGEQRRAAVDVFAPNPAYRPPAA